jgi:hypothetical protein
MKNLTYSFFGLLIFSALWIHCAGEKAGSEGAAGLVDQFPDRTPGDTLFIGLDEGWDGDTISHTLIWAELDSVLLAQLSPDPDSLSMLFMANGSWMQDSLHRVCLLNVEQSWWQFRFLLVYDQERQAFVRVEPVAMFYGGDGGQTASSSYLFDHDGDGDRDLLVRTADHGIRMSEEGEAMEWMEEGGHLRDWSNGAFRDAPMPLDSAAVVEGFGVVWPW